MNLLMFNMSNIQDWEEGIVNRNYFVAREVLRQQAFDQVFFVDFLAVQSVSKQFGWRRTLRYAQRLTKQGARQGWLHRSSTQSGAPFGDTGKSFHTYEGLGLLTNDRRDFDRIHEWLAKYGANAGNLVVWSYNAFLPESLDMPARLRVFDAVDNWSLHASYAKQSVLLKRNYQLISGRADLVFTVSDGLRALFPANKTHWIPNGIDTEPFENNLAVPNDIATLKKPLVGYVGTVQERLDFELLEHVCKQHADKTFVFIGPVWGGVKEQVQRLQSECANVRFLGRRAYKDIPAYMNAMNAAIIPHRLDAFINSTNPMKMYEYLAAGKPVITTPGAGTELFEKHMYIAQTAPEFARAISDALAQNSPDKERARREAVRTHSWEKRVSDMLTLVKSKL